MNEKDKLHNVAERMRKTSKYNKLVDGRAEWLDGYNKGKNKILAEVEKMIDEKYYLKERKLGLGTGKFWEEFKGELQKLKGEGK